MYTIEFYENENGKGEMIEYIRKLHKTHKEEFYKMAAFLDFLGEKGCGADKQVGRSPEGIIYMHCIGEMTRLAPEGCADPWYVRAGRRIFRGRRPFFRSASLDGQAVCVILYGRNSRQEKGGASFVMLHHYFTNRMPGGIPFLQMYRAVRRLRKIHYQNTEH